MIELLTELDRIGELNSENFEVRLEPQLLKTPRTVYYTLTVLETENVFTGGGGSTPDEAATRAMAGIPSACEAWGYAL